MLKMRKSITGFLFSLWILITEASSTTTVSVPPQPVSESNSKDNAATSINNATAASATTAPPSTTTLDLSYISWCPSNVACDDLGASCLQCRLNYYCVYGDIDEAKCTAKPNVSCQGDKAVMKEYHCRYCYQLDPEFYSCDTSTMAASCTMKKAPPEVFYAKCRAKEDVLCLGDRTFYRKLPCSWTQGYKWSTALVLSITLGGFGVDRFYLGMWREGLGKLFSFGGLGVWTIVDVILIAVGYIGPHDSSLFIYPWD